MHRLREHCMCRLCLSTGCHLVDILDENYHGEFVVKQAVESLLQLVVIKEALYPWMVCSNCVKSLREFHIFKRRCVECQEVYDIRIRGKISSVSVERSTECGDIALKFEEDGSNGGLLVQDSHHLTTDSYRLEENQSTMGGDIDIDIPVKAKEDGSDRDLLVQDSHRLTTDNYHLEENQSTMGGDIHKDILMNSEEDISVEDPLGHGTDMNSGSDKDNQTITEHPSIDSKVSLTSEESDGEDNVEERDPFGSEDDDESKPETADVSIHGIGDGHSDNVEDEAGSRVSQKDRRDFFDQDSSPRLQSSRVIVKLETLREPEIASSSMSCQRKSTEMFVCSECGASFDSQTSLSTHARGHQMVEKTVGSGEVCGQRNEDDPQFPHSDCNVFTQKSDLSIRRKKSLFGCDHCGKVYAQKDHLVDHIRSIHLEMRNLECTVTGRRSDYPHDFSESHKEEKKRLVYDCSGSSKKGTQCAPVNSLDLQVKPYCCSICARGFQCKSKLSCHITTVHSSERRFKCGVCGKAYKMSTTLKTHMLTHSSERSHRCPLCPRSFLFRYQLTSHIETHSGLTYACELCGKEFNESSRLRGHKRRHASERSYKCAQCPKAYKSASHLARHSATHSDEGKFSCEICGRKFFLKDYLNDHMRIHDGKRPFQCEVCSKMFSTKSNLRQHATRHQERTHECHRCHKLFKTKQEVKGHLVNYCSEAAKEAERPFKCEECSKTFKFRSSLSEHAATHSGQKSHVCSVCSKAFLTKTRLGLHLRRHDEKREVFRCGDCGMTTVNKWYLKRHMEVVHGENKNEDGAGGGRDVAKQC